MANVNTKMLSERFLNTSAIQHNVALHSKRIQIAESVRAKQGRAPLTLETKAALATCLENTRQICEATQSSHIPSKTFFMDMVASVIPNVIAPDLVSVQAMDAKAGMISYLRFVYGDKKGRTEAGQMFNNSLYKGVSDPEYSASTVTDEPLAADADGVAKTSFYPLVPRTVEIDGTVDDGQGKIGGTITVDYATGKISGLDALTEEAVSYQYDNESAPVKVPQINLELAQIPIFAHSRKLAAYWGFDAAYDLKKQYGEDVTTLMATQAAGEIAHEIDTEIVLDLYNQAGAGAELVWSRTAPVGVFSLSLVA